MKVNIETRFNVGDVVWRKNLVTNEASQVTISRLDVYFFAGERKTNYCVLYHVEGDTPMCNLPDKVSPGQAFVTKEEADACPPYDPTNP